MSIKFTMQLARDLVAVRPEKPKTKFKLGVPVLPDWHKSLEGSVLGIGPKVSELRVGDRVVFGAAKGMESVYNGAAIRIMRFDDVDMVLEGENATPA